MARITVAPTRTRRGTVTIVDKETGQELALTTDPLEPGATVLIDEHKILKIGTYQEGGEVRLRDGRIVTPTKAVVIK